MELGRALEILEIDENSSPAEIKQRYKDLAAIWHPDRHSNNARRQKLATEKMKELNAAYDYVRSYLVFIKESEEIQSEEDVDEQILVTCPSCGTKNRIRKHYKNLIISCGNCGNPLFTSTETDYSDDWGQRTLCGDDECIGIIGPDGRCNYCGKSYEEGRKASEAKENFREENTKRDIEAKKKRKSNWKRFYYASFGIALAIYLMVTVFDNSEDTPKPKPNKTSSPEITLQKPKPKSNKATTKTIKLKPSKDIFDQIDYEKYFTKIFFDKSEFNRGQIILIQNSLLTLGYDVGETDGFIGSKTLSGLQRFSEDFCFVPEDSFCLDLLKKTIFHARITIDHPDWKAIYINNQFEDWMNQRPATFKRKILNANIENPRTIIHLLNIYKFEKNKPPALALPINGVIKKTYSKGIAPLKIKTKYKDQHHFIKLVNQANDKEILTAFIRGGTSLLLDVPLGRYKLKTAVGDTWYGVTFLFGPNTIYSIADEVFKFEISGEQVFGYTVELFLKPSGNLRTINISAFEF